MPVHSVPKTTLHEDIRDIERQGEVIVSVVDNGDRYTVFTMFRDERMETRLSGLSHAARVGVQ